MSIHIARYCAVALAASALAGASRPLPQAQLTGSGLPIRRGRSQERLSLRRYHLPPETGFRGQGPDVFDEIDQAKLAADAGITAMPSTLLVFGNPALGTQFITANQQAGIDWPVRLLVYQDREGQVWAEYTDFGYIAKRHAIVDRDPQFQKASEVIASIAASVAVK